MEIKIGFSRRKMAFSRFLQWAEKREYSHCYVRYSHPFTGQDLVLHAAGLSIHTLTFENFQKHGNIVVKEYVLDVKDKKILKDTVSFIYNVSGNPYGWTQLIGMGYVKLMKWIGFKVANPLGDKDKTMVCSEFCAHVIEKTGLVSIDISKAEVEGPSWVDLILKTAKMPEAPLKS